MASYGASEGAAKTGVLGIVQREEYPKEKLGVCFGGKQSYYTYSEMFSTAKAESIAEDGRKMTEQICHGKI